MNPRRILVFDAAASGHHGEFLENLIAGADLDDLRSLFFLCHPELEKRLVLAQKSRGLECNILPLTETEIDYFDSAKGIFELGKRQLEVLSRHVDKIEPSEILLMHMNFHQYALRSWQLPKGVSVRGILLNPYTPTDRAHGFRAKAFAFLTGIRKRIQFCLMLQNKAIEKIFLLNDPRMAMCLNEWHHKRPVFGSICDPIPASSPVSDPTVNRGSYTLLLAGSLAPRKGCIEALLAFAELGKATDRRISLRIVGRFRSEEPLFRRRACELVDSINLLASHLDVRLEEGFVEDDVLSREFANADCILVPYLEFYGSSGMIGHACRYRKPILACRDGLIGEIVRDRSLGICIDPRDRKGFSQRMLRMLEDDFVYDAPAAEAYVSQACYRKFASSLLRK